MKNYSTRSTTGLPFSTLCSSEAPCEDVAGGGGASAGDAVVEVVGGGIEVDEADAVAGGDLNHATGPNR